MNVFLTIILQFAPSITPHARSFVHHIIVTQCPQVLRDDQVGLSMPCDDFPDDVRVCQTGIGYGGWAVGGEVGINLILLHHMTVHLIMCSAFGRSLFIRRMWPIQLEALDKMCSS